VRAAGDKYRLRRALARAGLRTPGFRLVSRQADPATACGEISFPCVLKPLSLSGSRGVIRADDGAAFVAAFRRLNAILDAADPAARNILVEDYIPGTELAAEGLLVDGRYQSLALFDKPDALDGPYFEETLYVTPSRLLRADQDLITGQVAAGAAALGLRHGPVHAEIRLNRDGPWIIELAARSIGGLCSRSLRFGAGLRLEELILMHATGRALGRLVQQQGASGVMMIPIPAAGILRGIDGAQAALAEPGIEDVRITIPVGQTVVPLPEGDRYLGFIFARGATAAEVEAALRSAHARLSFAIVPAPAAVDA
jgi:biotin carboxylase